MKHSNHHRLLICLALTVALILEGCSLYTSPNAQVTVSGFYFDTLVNITIYGTNDRSPADECLEICSYYDGLLSMTVESSDISRINNAGTEPVKVSGETIDLLEYAYRCYESSDGLLDISVAPASRLWMTARESKKLPDNDSISDAVSLTGLNRLNIDRERSVVSKDIPGLSLDVGALGKGYVADRLKEMLVSKGVKSAVISLGGNIITIGNRPDGTPFKIGIKQPFSDNGSVAATLNISGMSVVTSGIYERYFIVDDKLYHHILNPQTGMPADTDLSSATIISSSSLDGDALSTRCLLLGLDDSMTLIKNTPDAEAVFITRDNKLHYTEGADKYL
ncbi:MAG: FAD:protein FMN transferase [Lachnospiraceae bacterium]|nr:FAD:protein FMN transferase [Lachnospiraceae bacterium]